MKKKYLFAAASGLLVLPGCLSVGPDYQPQKLPDTGLAQTGEPDAEALDQWWNTLNDSQLTELIDEALTNNNDLKSAVAAVRAARAQLGIARANLGPQLDAAGRYSRNRNSDDVTPTGQFDLYSGGFDAAWEIDLFGGTRRSVEAAVAALEAQEAGRADVQVSLAAETAQSYVLLRSGQQRLRVARENLRLQQDTFSLLQSRFASGLSNELELQQARYNLESTRAVIPQIEDGVEQTARKFSSNVWKSADNSVRFPRTGIWSSR
jgi:outer membrane protein TolC